MEFALEMISKASLLLLLLLPILGLLRKASAMLRHWLISTVMLLLLALPVLIIMLPKLHLPVWPAKAETPVAVQSPSALTAADRTKNIATALSAPTTTVSPVSNSVEATGAPVVSRRHLSRSVLCFGLWGIVAIFLLFRLANGLRRLRKLALEASTFSAHHRPVIQQALGQFAFSYRVRILEHARVTTPMTWTLGRPLILLPPAAAAWPSEELYTVLQHELAHIQRRDFLLHLLGMVSTSIYWFHPLVWWLKKQQLLEREKACDEAVVATGIEPADYAEKLLAVARRLLPNRQVRPTLAIPMAQASLTKQRILALMQQSANTRITPVSYKWLSTAGLLLLLPLLAALRPAAMPVLGFLPVFDSLPAVYSAAEAVSLELIREENTAEQPFNGPLSVHEDGDEKKWEATTSASVPLMQLANVPQIGASEKRTVSSTEKGQLTFGLVPVAQMQGQYGSWEEGRSRFRVWTKGSFRLLPIMPYVETSTTNDLIVIEEKRGNKTYRLVISRASEDGALIQSYLNGQPNSWSAIRQSDNLYLWTINDEWVFLGRGLERWMAETLPGIAAKLADTASDVWQSADEKNTSWKYLIDSQEALKTERFRPDLAVNGWEDGQSKAGAQPLLLPTFDLSKLPLPAGKVTANNDDHIRELGYTTASAVTTGWSGGGDHQGMRYGTLIRSEGQQGQLLDFNFHLRYNLCANAQLQLYLYTVENGLPTGSLLPQPVIVETGAESGWISTDLHSYQLLLSSDVLVVLELLNYDPGVKKGGLFFSHADRRGATEPQIRQDHQWDFTLVPLAAYLRVQ